MSAQASPTEHSIAENIPTELWERIAYYANVGSDAFLGPPVNIPSLCLVCSTLYSAIRFDDNTSLYARLFCCKFDYLAPLRRLGHDLLTAQSLAREFKKRIDVLKRVRARRCSNQDLWTCYLMMLENDGRNERQLIEWAHLYGFLKSETCMRFETDLNAPINWFRDIEGTSLLLWLWWLTFSREDLRVENSHVRESLVRHLLQNLVVASFRYPNVYGPESHLYVPTADATWSSTPLTPLVCVEHYSTHWTLATPLLSIASLLVWTARVETGRETSGFDRTSISSYPADREAAIARRVQGPTQLDVIKFYGLQIQVPSHCSVDTTAPFRDEIMTCECRIPPKTFSSLSGSWKYDGDWNRALTCADSVPTLTPKYLPTYRLGAVTGPWAGFTMQTSFDTHMQLVDDPTRTPSEDTALFQHPLYFTLKEHYCLSTDIPIGPGNDCLGGDDILNAWLPQGLKIQEHENDIAVFEPTTQRLVRYHTYNPEMLETEGHSQKKVPGPPGRKSSGGSSFSEGQLNDVLVTGNTSDEDGAAWGYYDFVGRVRLWDGFIILLRTPRDSTRLDLGKWIFKGYIHNENLVGHWRETATSPELVGHRGGFIARNRNG
ncbi:hypothetical protein D9757_009116 [Collybiopsis confluens]|uniref:Uncharacterized protein n=1 Tax=Collybiopsis confluens TaxID=2823264 RepID=A0A8H5M2K6_9AGAR|nr:hypothetical protein D9757_009116 [Collybiopsis confluens]